MESLPDSVNAVIAKWARKYPSDIAAAVEKAVDEIRRSSEFEGFVDQLVEIAVRRRIHDWRHTVNRGHQLRTGLPPVQVARSKGVNRAAVVYQYCIAGTTLGDLTGEQLGPLACVEREQANGHARNARLLERLSRLGIPPKKRVRDVVPESSLRRIIAELDRSRAA
jgi:hypothetical protein